MRKSMCVKPVICLLLVLAALPLCVGQVYAPQPFSADVLVTTHNSKKMTGKWYFSPPNFRMDMNTEGRNVSTITDGSSQTSYVIMHEQHMYMEMHGNQGNPMARTLPKIETSYDPNNPCAAANREATCKKLGTEVINGRLCDKWQGTSKQGTTTFWMDQKLHFPMKTLDADGSGMEFSNVKEGKSDASLFQPPAGYRKMDLGGMMGGRPPQ